MNEIYYVDGVPYEVSPSMLAEFLRKFPNATKSQGTKPIINKSRYNEGEEDLSGWDNFKNVLSNTFEEAGDIFEFWGLAQDEETVQAAAEAGSLGANSNIQIASTAIWERVFGRETMKRWKKTSPGFFKTYIPSDSATFKRVLENFEKEEAQKKKTLTFGEADSLGDYLSVGLGAVVNVGGSVVKNFGTAFTGYFFEFAAQNYVTANEVKAKSMGLTLNELVASGNADVDAAVKIAGFQAGLEYFGVSKILKPFKVGKAMNKKVGEYLSRNYSKSSGKKIRIGLDLGIVGSLEGSTEMGQTALEMYNEQLATAKATGEDINDAWQLTQNFFSAEAFEAGLQGFFGAGGLRGAGYSAKALNSMRSSDSALDIEEELKNVANLSIQAENNKDDEEVKSSFDDLLNDAKEKLRAKIKKGNDIYNSLTDGDIKKIESLTDLADVTASRAVNLINKYKEGKISKKDFNTAFNGLQSKYKENKQNIRDIMYKKNVEFAVEEGERIGKKVVEVKSKEEFKKIYEEKVPENQRERDADGNIIDVSNRDGMIIGDEIYINEVTAKETGAITVGSHELLHGIIGNSFDKLSPELRSKLGKSFVGVLTSEQEAAVRKRMRESYGLEGDAIFSSEEIFTVFSDAIAKNEITFNEGVFSKIANYIEETLRNLSEQGYIGKDSFLFRKEFSNGRQAYNFLKEYNANIQKGKLGQRATTFARGQEASTIDKPSITAEQKTRVETEVKDIGNTYAVEGGKKAWDEGGADIAIQEIKEGRYFDDLIAATYKADKVPVDFVDKVYSELTQHIKNFNPEENDNLFAYINSQVRNKAGNVYNREYKQTEQEKTAKDIDDRTKEGEVKVQVADETAEQDIVDAVDKTSIEGDKERVLSDFNVELEDGSFDAELEAEVTSLLEQNPPNLVEKFNQVVEKVLAKRLKDTLGKIRKIKGKVQIDAAYEKFIRLDYQEIINSLDITTIRTSYKNLFDKERVGTEDVKGVSKVTGLTTNFRKGIFVNKVNKAKFIKYFTQGGFTTLVERQSALFRRIAKAKANVIVDEYIEQNSNNPDVVIDAKLRSLSRTGEYQLNEKKTFDTVKFSYSKKFAKDLESDVNKEYYSNVAKKTKRRKPDGKIMYADKGRAFEKIIIDRLTAMGIPEETISVKATAPSEKGGVADVVLEINGVPTNLEAKLGEKVPMGSVLVSMFNFLTDGSYTLAKDENYSSIDFSSLMEQATPMVKKMIDAYNSYVDDYNNGVTEIELEDGTKMPLNEKGIVLKGEDKIKPITKIGDDMTLPIYKIIQARKLNIFGVKAVGNAQALADHYLAKTEVKDGKRVKSPVEYIEIFGRGLYTFVKNPSLKGAKNIIDIGEVTTTLYVKNSGTIKKNGNPVLNKAGDKKIRFQLHFQNSLTGLKEDSDVSILNKDDVGKMTNVKFSKSAKRTQDLSNSINNAKATKAYHKNKRGMSTFDFDETLIIEGENFITATKGEEVIKISSGQWPLVGEQYRDEGYTFDFKDFVNVRGGKEGPLLQKMRNQIKKFGTDNVFVLTARMQESDTAIHGWLKTQGIDIPIGNITGLGNSTGEAKALWMLDKFAQGYNDMYFVDDALPNVQAVKNALEQLDVKSKVQQAKVKFSNSMSDDFNNILEDVTGIDAKKRFSEVKAKKRGAGKGFWRIFIPPSHEDLAGLLYNFMGKGEAGNRHREFFERTILKPLNKAYREFNTARQSIANDYRLLNKKFKEIKARLKEKTPDGDFTYQDAIRVYLWNKHGHEIPGISKSDQAGLVQLIENDADLKNYANSINTISRRKDYVAPTEGWESGDIRTDLKDATDRVGRAEFFKEIFENFDEVFSIENLRKIEAAYGKGVRSALEDMIYRIKTGRNRPSGNNALVNRMMNYINGAVGSVMFFNVRSAVLQQMSLVNYFNFSDNNIFQAAKAFANQEQYWADWAFIFNSDMLKQRRGGIQTDVNGAELAETISKSKYPIRSLIRKLLQLGFLPTQIGDNIAIATGGAMYYRNRINTYINQGLSKAEAEQKAFADFQALTQSTQQSARPDMISQQQASPIGRLVLAFQNVTSQFNRLGKKAFLDIKNRRITPPNSTQLQSDISNSSRIAYYFAIQNMVFYGLQSALFAAMFDDEEDDERLLKKRERMINGSIDSVLRGSGLVGATIATLKNMGMKFAEQRKTTYNPDESAVIMEMFNLSPPLGIKARKIVNAERTLNYNKKTIEEMSTFDIDNPHWSAYTNYVEGITNLPVNRLYNKTQNVRSSLDNQQSALNRVLMFLGWSKYNLGVDDKSKSKKKDKYIKKRVL